MADNDARAALAARQEDFKLRKWAGWDPSERVMGMGTGTPRTRVSLALTASQLSRNKLRRWKDCASTTPPTVTTDHMPFRGHRTVAEVWADELRASTARGSG